MRIVVGTAVLAMFVSLDGDGSTTYMITVSAMLPLYKRLGISRLVLACVIMLAGGVMNILPWGGPTARAASALGVDVGDIFVPMIPAMIVGAVWVVFVAFILGRRERKRIGVVDLEIGDRSRADDGSARRRPEHLRGRSCCWVNVLLTAALMVVLILELLPLPVLFMIAFAIAIMINYPKLRGPEGTAHRARRQCAAGGVADLRGGHLRRHPVGHEDGRRDRGQRDRGDPRLDGPVPGDRHRRC